MKRAFAAGFVGVLALVANAPRAWAVPLVVPSAHFNVDPDKCLRRDIAFYLPTDPETLRNLATVQNFASIDAATFRFRTDAKNWRECSATVISPNGYVLTALHCLTECFESSQAVVERPEGTTVFKMIDSQKAHGLQCGIKVSGNSQTATVLFAGNGWVEGKKLQDGKRAGVPLHDAIEAAKAGLSKNGDFVVMKVSGTAPGACVSLAEHGPRLNDSVWNLAYPQRTNRDDGLNSDGKSKYFSNGTVTNGLSESLGPYGRASRSNGGEYGPDFEKVYQGTFWSSLDIVRGSSGSGIFNEEGKLVGVTSSSDNMLDPNSPEYRDEKKFYAYGTGIAVPVDNVLQSAKTHLTPDEFKSLMSCSPSPSEIEDPVLSAKQF